MKTSIYIFIILLIFQSLWLDEQCRARDLQGTGNLPLISGLTYGNISQSGVSVYWTTDSPADSKILWMVSDSNYQPLVFADSLYFSTAVSSHIVPISNLQPATIYKYRVISRNAGGAAADSGYFITQSASTGKTVVYFNHSVDTTVSTGEKANGNIDFSAFLIDRIDSAKYSIDITLWEFTYYTAVLNALIHAKNNGVKIRFIYTNNTPDSPLVESLVANGIPVLKRNYDTTHSMHNKFWIFDYRNNSDAGIKYLWTGSANVSHAQLHQDRNNVIVVQDESLCAAYTREFEEMWGSHKDIPIKSRARFGAIKVNNVPHIFNVAGVRMEAWFSPSDSVTRYVCNLISSETTKSLYFCMFKFTLHDFEDTLHSIFQHGMEISGVFDSSNSVDAGCAYPRMKGASVPDAWNPAADVFIDTITGLLHHKYFIVDAGPSAGNKITVTGSFNWEPDASLKNDENSLIVFDARVNNLYYQEFYKRYKESGGTTVGIHNAGSATGRTEHLGQNYPNPFSLSTVIPYNLPAASFVRLSIFDSHGIEVEVLLNAAQSSGAHTASWNSSLFPAGMYCIRLTAGGYTETRKMTVMK